MTQGPSTPRADRVLLYHFTHIDNLTSIFRTGLIVADARAGGRLTTDVGDTAIKAARRSRAVPTEPRGVVADYVPFYFAPRSPMMFRIACDHRDAVPGRYPGGDDPLIYLVTSVDRLTSAGLQWVATDGNAAAALSTFTNRSGALADLVDWPLMEAQCWNDTPDDLDRQRRRMAEVLVHRQVPIAVLHGCATRTEARRADLTAILTTTGHPDVYVNVRPDWYYGYSRRG